MPLAPGVLLHLYSGAAESGIEQPVTMQVLGACVRVRTAPVVALGTLALRGPACGLWTAACVCKSTPPAI